MPASAARPALPEDLRPLTALRFFAAAWVVGYDYWPRLAAARPLLLERGRLGVEVFFTLSGFILCHVYLRRWGEGRFSVRGFLWARLARIYPVHLATLAGLMLLIVGARLAGADVGENVVRWSSLPGELTLTHAWALAPRGGWNHPSWSLSAEWFAYCAFPAFAVAAWALRGRPWLAVAGAVAAGAALYAGFQAVAGFPLSLATTRFGWLRIAPPFAYGCALYLVWRARRAGAAPARAWPYVFSAAGALAAGAAACAGGLPDAAVVLAGGALILSLAWLPPAAFPPGRASGALVYLGEVSFSLYMMVMPWSVIYENSAQRLLHLPAGGLLPAPVWAGLVLGVLPAAMALHHLVERPARTWMRARGAPFTGRGRGAPRPEGAEPAFLPAPPRP